MQIIGPLSISDGWIEKQDKLIHLVAPLISQPNKGTKNRRKINKIDNKFNSLLKSLIGKSDIKIKVRIEINKYKICLTRRIREYSVPINE